jgi:hypothetical protein
VRKEGISIVEQDASAVFVGYIASLKTSSSHGETQLPKVPNTC